MKDQINKIIRSKNRATLIQSANEQFGFKTTLDELYSLFQFTKFFRWIIPLFSIITGASFLYYLLIDIIHPLVSFVVSGLLLTAIEIPKHKIGKIALTRIYSNSRSFITFIFVFTFMGFISISVFMSLQGVKELHNRLDDTVVNFELHRSKQKDSLNTFYQNEIKALKTAKNDYISSVSWQGKIDIHNSTNKQVIANYDERIKTKEGEMASVLLEFKQQSNKLRNLIQSKNTFNSVMWLSISGIVELMIVLCVLFEVYYMYRVFQEEQIINSDNGYDIGQIASYIVNRDVPVTIAAKHEQKQEIGFKPKTDKYQEVVSDLKNGITDARTLMKKHHINVKTLTEIKKKYNKS